MTEPQQTFLNPDLARPAGNTLGAAAETLAAEWSRVTGTIRALNEARPWGDDEAGRTFNEHYLDGGDEAPAKVTLDAGDDLIAAFADTGLRIVSSVDGTVDDDGAVGDSFGGGR
ncbi:hypothetical protein O7621_03920 [Solwaraspora sp. WMMD937]|uniref:hypothetical protein n=1 Tax=Solwaraspora sp. WMMD937 TaxID=3016090 RepID=UPI00249B161E|nr:hypothetical protein [Solwaraspora sp. WMMD937]WFE22506.1 hypothetical protein O7621_03920 [Solwaraspora sp. WMMD937]